MSWIHSDLFFSGSYHKLHDSHFQQLIQRNLALNMQYRYKLCRAIRYLMHVIIIFRDYTVLLEVTILFPYTQAVKLIDKIHI